MQYIGQELDLFRHARAWKAYYSSIVKTFVQGDVLEVGGGIGGTTPYLLGEAVRSYTIMEPDPALHQLLKTNTASLPGNGRILTINQTVHDLPATPCYDAIVYIDVLEHIKDDVQEVKDAFARLRPGGKLILLSPAFEKLRSPFDYAVGHWRRYTIQDLRRMMPECGRVVEARYFDCVGAALSLGNRLVTKDAMPTEKQILFWNRFIIPLSRLMDPLFKKWWGRSVLVVAEKT